MIGWTAIKGALLSRPSVAVAAVAVTWAVTSGALKNRTIAAKDVLIKACESELIGAGNRTVIDNLTNNNKLLRTQLDLIADQRDEAAKQEQLERAAKWRARNALDELRTNPDTGDFLAERWPDAVMQRVCSTKLAARLSGCLDPSGSANPGTAGGVEKSRGAVPVAAGRDE